MTLASYQQRTRYLWLVGPLAGLLVGLLAACTAGEPAPMQRSLKAPGRPEGCLLVLRLGGPGVEVVKRTALMRLTNARRQPQRGGGRYEVRDGSGRTLAKGWFRLPRRIHALLGAAQGPATGVSVPLRRPVVWLRVATPPGAARLVLFDGREASPLGEVPL